MSRMTSELAQRILAREISAPEKLLWSGPPRQGLIVTLKDLIIGPLLALSVVLFFSGQNLDDLAADPWSTIRAGLTADPLVGVVVVYALVGRVLWSAWRRRDAWYALTDLRAIFVQQGWPNSVKSEFLVDAIEITLRESRDGRGTIIFGPSKWLSGKEPLFATPAFIEIEDARSVYRRFFGARAALRKLSKPSVA